MRTPFVAASASALVLALTAGAACARDIPSEGLSVGDVVAWLQSKGFAAQVETGSDGKAHVSSADGGVKFGVYMFDCTGDHCASMQFSAGFATHGKFDTSRMNDWNRDQRWARGYFDKENDPWVEYDVDLSPGGTYEQLDDELGIWRKMLSIFVKRYDLM